MFKRFICILVMLFFIIGITGCATLFKAKTRTVDFDSDPQGATVYINGNRMGKTPMPLNLSNKTAVTVTFKKEGYEDKTYIINTKVGAGWVILDCLGGFIPIIIDAVTENWYSLDTDAVKVMLDVERK
ncbi:MAG: PEGA domain-containing protein [Candidatus Omnitrophica bacterium]|nr:PEGA domain-containing protein [Candidatus Omnitrophota bacterium]MBU2251489.1 PEGA domain-containing protein [Candidatus Omnitrophota bacterium]